MAQLKLGTLIGGNLAWHQGNDGTGSGLDADLLDGQHGSYYQPALGYTAANKAGDTFTGNVAIQGTLTARTTTISGESLVNTPALTITNVGAGNAGILLGVLRIGDQQDQARLTAFRVANKALAYTHAGTGISGQGAHRFTGDATTGTSVGATGSIVDILAPSTASNIFQCRQSDGTVVLNVDYLGKITHNGLTATEGLNVDQVKTITKSLTLTTDWQDTGIKSTDLETGTYVVQLVANDTGSGGTNNNEYYSGTMSWYSGDTNSALEMPTDEIVLHRAGGSGDGALYLRTFRTPTANPDNLKLQIYSNTANASAANYVFKFRRII